MSVLLTRGTRLSQPPGPVEVNWANPLTAGIGFVFTPNTLFGADVVNRYDDFSAAPLGRVKRYAAGAVIPYDQFTSARINSSGPKTYLAWAIHDQASTFYGLMGNLNASGNGIHVRPTSTNLRVRINSSTEFLGPTYSVGGEYLQIFSISGSRVIFSVNGVEHVNTASAALPNAFSESLTVGEDYLNTYFMGRVYLAAVWNRALSSAEIKQLSANPWQLFKPVQRQIWVPVSAGGGGTSQTIAFTLDDLTASVSQTLSHSQSAAFTLDGISSTVNQAVTHSQSLSATLGDITASISQELAGAKSQSIAFTLDGITASVSQTASHAQSLAITLDDVTVAISQSAAPSSKDQSLAITLDDIFVDIKQAGPRRRQAGGKRNYIIKGKKYHLNDYELAAMIQGMLEEVERSDVEIDDGEAVKKVSRRVWKQLKESNAQLDFTLKELQSKVAIQEIDDEDDIALLML